jgi:hypothetical protein
MLNNFLLEPCLSHLALVLWVIILLEDNTQFPSSPQIKVLQGPKIVVIKDLDIQWAQKALQCLAVLDYLQCGAIQWRTPT